ncbi:hypothetical protein VIGAN_07135800, partial [Vigna angularis var. angularis]
CLVGCAGCDHFLLDGLLHFLLDVASSCWTQPQLLCSCVGLSWAAPLQAGPPSRVVASAGLACWTASSLWTSCYQAMTV